MPKESRTLLVSVHGLTWTYSLYIPKIRVFDLGHGRNSVGVPRWNGLFRLSLLARSSYRHGFVCGALWGHWTRMTWLRGYCRLEAVSKSGIQWAHLIWLGPGTPAACAWVVTVFEYPDMNLHLAWVTASNHLRSFGSLCSCVSSDLIFFRTICRTPCTGSCSSIEDYASFGAPCSWSVCWTWCHTRDTQGH